MLRSIKSSLSASNFKSSTILEIFCGTLATAQIFRSSKIQISPKNNHSGHKGVWFDRSRNMWEAYLQLHGKRIHLGRYHSYADAVIAREQGEKDYFKPLIESKERDYDRAKNHHT